MRTITLVLLSFIVSLTCVAQTVQNFDERNLPMMKAKNPYANHAPFTRWWWFAGNIDEKDIVHQLDWLKAHNFGGVEIAWLYPLHRYNSWMKPKYDTVRTRPEWLSPDWQKVVTFTKNYADKIGLGCDFTFGTSWPEGDSKVSWKDRTQIWGDTAFKQTLTFTWEYPTIGLVINHMDRGAFYRFANRFMNGLRPAINGNRSALLCESWEIKLNGKHKLWTPGFEKQFHQQFGYDILPYMPKLDSFPDVRYDYMKLVGKYVNEEFYQPFADICRKNGMLSRAECLGAPTDVMTTYAIVDVPETESMLNDPNFAKIVSSSGCLARKKVISSETFTCMYGFPRTLHQQEQTADLKMVADAMFAHGVNQIFWHGMPYNPAGVDTQYFFATVHVGKKGALTSDFADFNRYMQKVSFYLRQGVTYSDVAVYIPFEDAVMKGPLPTELQRVWVWGEYELRYAKTPDFLKGYHPLWINGDFLKQAKIKNGRLVCGDASFRYLYIDVKYIDYTVLKTLYKIAKKGFPITLTQTVQEPGLRKHKDFAEYLQKLIQLPNVTNVPTQILSEKPLVTGDSLPDFWCRKVGDELLLFFANPKYQNLKYPIYSGQSFQNEVINRHVSITVNGKTTPILLAFPPYQSLLYRIKTDGSIHPVDISYTPPKPIIRPKTKEKMNF